MKTIAAGKFKAQCLALIDDVHNRGDEVLITKRGRAMAKLVPVEDQKRDSIFGFLRGQAKIVGDIMEPTMTDEEVVQWEREWDDLHK